MAHIFKPGDRAYFPAKNKWVTLRNASTSRLPNLLEIEEDGIYVDPTYMLSPINISDPCDPNNPPEFRASRWIHVIDDLPKENVEVLFGVFDPTTQIFQGYMRDGCIFSDFFENSFLPVRGMYWQVLPGLPKNIYKDLEEK